MAVDINQIPHFALEKLNATRAVIMTTSELDDRVLISTSLDPRDLHETPDLGAFSECRRHEGVYAITMTVLKMNRDLVQEATGHLQNRYRIIAELDTLLRYSREVYVAYAITHYNPGQKPFGPLTINIGGDCYRDSRQIRDLEAVLHRTRDLAEAMLKKAVMIFPDIPTLHGGKKGEWIILDRDGRKIEGLSEEAIIALGSAIIPKGIHFLNRYKEQQAQRMGMFPQFPDRDYVRPDSASPDVLSGVYWRGERKDKYINMCDAWFRRGVDMTQVTCLPDNLGGTQDSSARPTGYGVATTAVELARRYFAGSGRELKELQFLLEAAGGVGSNTVEALIHRHGVPPENITVFDRNETASTIVAEKFLGVKAITLSSSDFYSIRLQNRVRRGTRYDVWVNNGQGDTTTPDNVRHLLRSGVRVFCGGANNLLQVKTQEESRRMIFEAGGWIWPDEATSGGGWTLAVIDILTRSQGRKANTSEIRYRILDIITSRNSRLVEAVLASLPESPSGRDVWQRVMQLIAERVERTLSMELASEEIYERANTRLWNLA